jgi:ATP-binding cassette subfamily F protein uup
MHRLGKGFNGQQLISDFNYIFKKGDRIGVAGKNGSGKSTLLNLITGKLSPDEGEIIPGETTVIGYFHQSGINFNGGDRVLDVVKTVADYITMADGKTITASALLTLFLFPPKKQYGLIANLSGGEKKRLQLLQILMKNPNFLILDEPTNDLDIDTLNVLEEFLTNYTGVLMLVSHDRYLLDKLTDQLFILEGNGAVRIFNGNYSSWRYEQEQEKQQAKKTQSPSKDEDKPIQPKKSKLSFKEQKELESLSNEISGIENQIEALTGQMNSSSADHNQLSDLGKQIQTLNDELDKKSLRWMELTDLNES